MSLFCLEPSCFQSFLKQPAQSTFKPCIPSLTSATDLSLYYKTGSEKDFSVTFGSPPKEKSYSNIIWRWSSQIFHIPRGLKLESMSIKKKKKDWRGYIKVHGLWVKNSPWHYTLIDVCPKPLHGSPDSVCLVPERLLEHVVLKFSLEWIQRD